MPDLATLPFDATPADEAAPSPDRRKLFIIIAAGVVAFAVLGFLVVTMLFGGSGDSDKWVVDGPYILTPSEVAARQNGAPLPAASALPVASAAPVPTPSVRDYPSSVNRHAFLSLIRKAPAVSGAGGAPAAPAAPAAPPAAPADPPPSNAPGKTTFTLVSVTGNSTVVTVNGKKYSPSVGETFASTFKLLSTSENRCAKFSRSEGTISMCEGSTFIY